MSTIKTTNIAHPSSASNNIVLDSSGGVDLDALTVSGSAPADSVNIDASGRLLVGTSSARSNVFSGGGAVTPTVQIENNTNTWSNGLSILNYSGSSYGASLALGMSASNTAGTNALVSTGQLCGRFHFLANDGTNFYPVAEIGGWTDGTTGTGDVPGRLTFSTTADGASSPTERMRIRADGLNATFCAATTDGHIISSAASAGTTNYLIDGLHSASGILTGTRSFRVFTNGNVQNTNNSYGSLSDIKLKENIVDASSQWNDLKALQVRNYNFKEGQTHTQIGLIAQEVELVSPGLVTESPDRDEDGNDLGTVTKSVNYSVLYMKAVKALQEAMERIEQLETEMAEVKAQLQAS